MRAFCKACMLLVLCMAIPLSVVYAEGEETTRLTIRYEPVEGNTTNWSLWVWGDGDEGARFPFTSEGENGVKIAEIELPERYEKVGFIVSTEDWIKDGGDQYIDIVNGAGEAYVVGGTLDAAEGGGNMPKLWLIAGPVLVVLYITIMEQLRRRRPATA
ncbi:Pullulanase precursor [compost metagenome]